MSRTNGSGRAVVEREPRHARTVREHHVRSLLPCDSRERLGQHGRIQEGVREGLLHQHGANCCGVTGDATSGQP